MKIYCVYGHGKVTEVCPLTFSPPSPHLSLTRALQRSYWYTQREYEYEYGASSHGPAVPTTHSLSTTREGGAVPHTPRVPSL